MAPPLELSIPATTISTPTHGKPFTSYNITLRLPLRTFVVQKRYSEFLALQNSLASLTSTPPPSQLPSKSWFKSTVSSPELTESRRKGLENYLRSIAETPDRRWRETSAWRAFLNLPSATGSGEVGSAKGNLVAATQKSGAGDPIGWMDVHREVKGLLHDARLCLGRRDGATTVEGQYEAGAGAKRALVRVGVLLGELETGLRELEEGEKKGENWALGKGELRRRKDLLASLRTEKDSLEKLSVSLATKGQANLPGSSTGAVATTQHKNALFGPGVARPAGRVLGAPIPETAKTRELDNEGVLQLQKQMMEDQDVDVEELGEIVKRQLYMAEAIGEEVDLQNKMLERVDEDATRVQSKIDIAKKRVAKIS